MEIIRDLMNRKSRKQRFNSKLDLKNRTKNESAFNFAHFIMSEKLKKKEELTSRDENKGIN